MLATYHLLILNDAGTMAAVEDVAGGGFLPYCEARSQRRSAHDVMQAATALSDDPALIYIGFPQYITRADQDGVEWLAIVRARRLSQGHKLRWVSPSSLDPRHFLFPSQQRLVARYLEHGIPAGPCQDLDWPERLADWMRDVCGGPTTPSTVYRAQSHVLVRKYLFEGRPVFVKVWKAPSIEADLTNALDRKFPDTFPRTLAHDRSGHRWAIAHVGGRNLRKRMTLSAASAAMRRMAEIQRSLADDPAILEGFDLPRLTPSRLLETAKGIVDHQDLAADIRERALAALSTLHQHASRLDDAHGDDGDSFQHGDPAPCNIYVDGDAVRFIDLAEAWNGPTPAGFFGFLAHVQHMLPRTQLAAEGWVPELVRQYTDVFARAGSPVRVHGTARLYRGLLLTLQSLRFRRFLADTCEPGPAADELTAWTSRLLARQLADDDFEHARPSSTLAAADRHADRRVSVRT